MLPIDFDSPFLRINPALGRISSLSSRKSTERETSDGGENFDSLSLSLSLSLILFLFRTTDGSLFVPWETRERAAADDDDDEVHLHGSDQTARSLRTNLVHMN